MATPLQMLGPIGSEIDLREHRVYLIPPDGYSMKPHTTRVTNDIAGGSVVMPRDEDNYQDLVLRVIIFGEPFTVRRARRDAIITVLAAASLYTKTQGREGTAAFYLEQWGDDPAPDVFPVVTGRLTESNRNQFSSHFDCQLDLVVRNKL
jgi:hypothetical protein